AVKVHPYLQAPSRRILGIRIDATNYEDATAQVLSWARERRSCYVCLGTVNHVMTAQDSPEFRRVMDQAAFATADGMPLVWMLRALGIPGATRVYGPDLTLHVLEAAAALKIAVGFYGGTPEVLEKFVEVCRRRFPSLPIVYAQSPPFRELTVDEDA